jgi:hypothetical protein
MDLHDVGLGSVDWIYLIEDGDEWLAVVTRVMNLQVPKKGGECTEDLNS